MTTFPFSGSDASKEYLLVIDSTTDSSALPASTSSSAPMSRLTRHQQVLCRFCSQKTHFTYYAHCTVRILSPWPLVVFVSF